jgi:hypothetical protein
MDRPVVGGECRVWQQCERKLTISKRLAPANQPTGVMGVLVYLPITPRGKNVLTSAKRRSPTLMKYPRH